MKDKLRVILIGLFSIVLLVSGGFFAYDFLKGEEDNPLLEDSPAEIIVPEEEKEEVELEPDSRDYVKISPDVNLAQKRYEYNNQNIIGRLEIPELFNVLVVKGKDNGYYLNHSIYNTNDARGTEFMDYRVNPDSKQINIYGHNSRNKNLKIPFLKLEKFLDEAFFNANPYIIFQHDNGRSVYKITAIKEVTTYEHMVVEHTGSDFINQINWFKTDAIHVREVQFDEDSDIIVLQTCSHNLEDAYYIIVGIKKDYRTE